MLKNKPDLVMKALDKIDTKSTAVFNIQDYGKNFILLFFVSSLLGLFFACFKVNFNDSRKEDAKDFVKVNLKPGESKMITFDLTRSDLSYLDDNGNPVFESGAFDIMVGTNSSNVMTATIDL